MLGIILLIIGVVYATRIPGIKKQTWDGYPARNPALFEEWRSKELKGIYIFIAATWGLTILFFGLGFILGMAFHSDRRMLEGLVVILTIGQLGLLVAGLVWAGIVGSQAGKLKKELMIPGAPAGGVYPRAGQNIVNMPAPPPEPPKFDA